MHLNIRVLILISIFTALDLSFAQNEDSLKQELFSALKGFTDYTVNVLLDEEGKSRCDYNMIEGKWYPYEEAWHTGQLIYGLVEAYRTTGDKNLLEEAKRAGDWWCSLLITDHPKLKGMVRAVHGDHAGNRIVFATVTDGTAGLFNLYKETGNKKYAEVPTSAGRWMMDNMYVPEYKLFYDSVNEETGEVMKENSPFWPNKEEQDIFDVARPNNEGSIFKDMYEFTGDEKYKEMFIELCESLLQYQGEEGLWMDFMPNHKNEGTFHPRFNLWYAESLLEGYDLTGDERYLKAAKKTLDLYLNYQRGDGTIYYKNYLDGRSNQNSVTGSAVAFAGMLWIRLVGYGVGQEYKDNIERSFNWITRNRYSIDHPDENLAGSLINLRTRRKYGKLWITQRDVGTAFGMRFLAAYYNYRFAESDK